MYDLIPVSEFELLFMKEFHNVLRGGCVGGVSMTPISACLFRAAVCRPAFSQPGRLRAGRRFARPPRPHRTHDRTAGRPKPVRASVSAHARPPTPPPTEHSTPAVAPDVHWSGCSIRKTLLVIISSVTNLLPTSPPQMWSQHPRRSPRVGVNPST